MRDYKNLKEHSLNVPVATTVDMQFMQKNKAKTNTKLIDLNSFNL
jgi:hypothetical protein